MGFNSGFKGLIPWHIEVYMLVTKWER